MNAQEFSEHYLQAAKIEEGGARNRVDQDVEIACFCVETVKHGSEDARISGAASLHEIADLATV